MEATNHNLPGRTAEGRAPALGGDRLYTLARWLVLFLLFATSRLLTQQSIWPPLQASNPVLTLVWAYALFTVLSTMALFFQPLGVVRSLAFFVDIVMISLLTFLSREHADLFYPLYLLPLIGVAIQASPATSLATAVATAVLYVLASLGGRISPDNGLIPSDMLGLVALALRAAALIFIPWLAGSLAERSGVLNRESVRLAERDAQRAMQDANAYRDRMQALYEVAYTLSTTMNYQSVLDTALIESRKLVPYTSALVLLSTGEPDELYVAASYGLDPLDRGRKLVVQQGTLSQAMINGAPQLLDNIGQDRELQPIVSLRNCQSACLVPLRAALRTYGVMLIASNNASAFGREQLDMITPLANYAIIALHNAQLVHDLREERTKLLSKEEEVRHQLARDLHDGPAQALAAITMNVEFIKRLLERDPQRIPDELDKLGALAKRTTHEVRTMLFELRPLVLETQGLDVTLRQYFERLDTGSTRLLLEADEISAHLNSKVEGTLFNILQESVNNALKHAKAQHIWVRVKQTPTTIEATVQDDGRGFDLKKVLASYEQRGSFGLLNIDERAKLIGGTSELHSAPGQGTTVRVIVPLS